MKHLSRMTSLLLAGVLAGCSNQPAAEKPGGNEQAAVAKAAGEAEGAYQKSWAALVASQPDAMKKLLEENANQGWEKLYARNYAEAQAAFEGTTTPAGRLGLARSHLADAELYLSAYRLALDLEKQYLALWDENASRLQKTDFYELMAGRAAYQSGDAAGALKHLQAFRSSPGAKGRPEGAIAAVYEGAALLATGDKAGAEKTWKDPAIAKDPGASALLIALRGPGGDKSSAIPEVGSTYGQRLRFVALVESGDLQAAKTAFRELDHRFPDYEEVVNLPEGSVTRRYYDPLVLRATARLHARKAVEALADQAGAAGIYRARAESVMGKTPAGVTGLPAQVDAASLPAFMFSEYATSGDMARDAARLSGGTAGGEGLSGAYLAALGPIPQTPGEGRDTRQAVEVAQAYIDAAKKIISAAPQEEGKSTLLALKVPEGDVRGAVRERARQYRDANRLLESLFLLEHSFDKENGKVSYLNDPLLFLEISRVYCSLKRYREAMNYFYRLTEARPELWLIQEILGNLSVLGTVDQVGRTGQQN